jgi:hypothetical protein
VRYGVNQNFFIRMSGSITREDCNNVEFGDPSPGNYKHCAYRPVSAPGGLDGKLPADTSFAQDQPFSVGYIPNPTLVSYTADNNASKLLYFSNPVRPGLTCSDRLFGDPAYGSAKVCSYKSYMREAPSEASWKTCATEGQTCAISDSIETVYVRYGVPGKTWFYYLAAAPSLPCGNDTFSRSARPGVFFDHFADPDYGESKFCQILSVPTVEIVVGRWTLVANQIGGGSLVHSVTSSVSGSRSTSRSESFSHSVMVGMEKESDFPIIGKAKLKAEYTFGYSDTKEVSNTISREKSETTTVVCNGGTKSSQLFQWGVDIDELCYISGNCKTRVDTLDYLCAKDQPPGYRPVVAPSLCGDDPLCLTLHPPNVAPSTAVSSK